MLLRLLTASVLVILVNLVSLLCPTVAAYADWTHPLSFSNAELTRKDFSGQVLQAADLRGAVMSASVMTKANLHGANLSNAMIDRVNLTGADLSDAIFQETLLLYATLADVNIEGADFTDAILDALQVKELCVKASGVNSQTGVQTRDSLGCR
jgi:uncharacterized protein YjbI with pentapeptide repeats